MLCELKRSQALWQRMIVLNPMISRPTELLGMTAGLTSLFPSLSPAVIKLKALRRYSWLFQMSRQTLYTFPGIHSSFLNLGGLKEKRRPGWRDGTAEGWGALWSHWFEPRENKEAAREKYTRPQVEPGLHPGEATQRKSPVLGLRAARRGQLYSCYSNMVSTWAKLPSHLFNTQTPHGAPRCHEAKGSYKHLMWGRFHQLFFLVCFFYSVITCKSLKVAPDRRVGGGWGSWSKNPETQPAAVYWNNPNWHQVV